MHNEHFHEKINLTLFEDLFFPTKELYIHVHFCTKSSPKSHTEKKVFTRWQERENQQIQIKTNLVSF